MRHLQDQIMSAANFGLVDNGEDEDEMDEDEEEEDEPDDEEDDISGGSSMARNSPKRGRLISDLLFPSSQHINENKSEEHRFETTAQDLSMSSKTGRYNVDDVEDIVNDDEDETIVQEDNEDDDTTDKVNENEEDGDESDQRSTHLVNGLASQLHLDADETKENMPADHTNDFRASPTIDTKSSE